MSKRVKRTKVRRAYDEMKKQNSTAGLMTLRIILIIVIILFIGGAATLCVREFQKEDVTYSDAEADTDEGAYYQRFTDEEKEKLIEYCNNSVTISEYYTVSVESYNGVNVSSVMIESLERMVEAAENDGIHIEVLTGYMTYDECERGYNTAKLEFESEGNSQAESEALARATFPPGGSNEYQTGMLIKVSEMDSEDFSKTDEYAWLFKNGINYGFINRYTEEKKTVTGRDEDLTIFRFVGTENAQKMRSFGMCLEEYYDYCSYR